MADSTTPVDVRVTPVSAGSVSDGTVVQMSSGATYAANNGSTLAAVSTNGAANQLLTVVEPRRAHLVYLRTYHGTYVNRDASMALYNQRTNAELSGTNAAVKASAAFWVIDWNGGELQDGDWISLESFENSSYHYASVIDGDHTGHARLANAVTAYEKFRINILNGATGSVTYSNDGAANDNNVVSLQSSHGTFLTAMPANYYSSQIRNYGPYEGDWQRFEIVFVQEFDRHRPTW
ncbi:MAG: hypothetical protein JNK05_25150 [Myxococcales bacterium]|nr:hypothetical protein [Myxococcales bacterium]